MPITEKNYYRNTYVTINLSAIEHNVAELKKSIPANAALMAVVKADGYGHGDTEVLLAAINAGAKWAGVALVEEAVKLRQNGFKLPILLLGSCPLDAYDTTIQKNITITIHSLETALSINRFAQQNKLTVPVHIKLDTGMGRLGFSENQLIVFLNDNKYFSHLEIDGLSSHLSSADEGDQDFSKAQLQKYHHLKALVKKQFNPKWLHISNSAGMTELTEERGNLFRMGISMYGQPPSGTLKKPPVLEEALSFKSYIIQLQDHQKNKPIGYGRTFITKNTTKVATIAVGYADGYSRLLSNKGQVLIGGQRAPIVGNVCMDMIMVDVTNIPGVNLYDEVVLIGKQGSAYISATEIASLMGTINYEVTAIISKRVPRFYEP